MQLIKSERIKLDMEWSRATVLQFCLQLCVCQEKQLTEFIRKDFKSKITTSETSKKSSRNCICKNTNGVKQRKQYIVWSLGIHLVARNTVFEVWDSCYHCCKGCEHQDRFSFNIVRGTAEIYQTIHGLKTSFLGILYLFCMSLLC